MILGKSQLLHQLNVKNASINIALWTPYSLLHLVLFYSVCHVVLRIGALLPYFCMPRSARCRGTTPEKKKISNRLEYLTNNNTLKNKPNNGKGSYFIVNEIEQNMPDISPELILCPVTFKTPSVKLKTPSSVPQEECSTITSSPDGDETRKNKTFNN